MASSAKEHMPSSKIVIGLLEKSIPDQAKQFPHFNHIELVKDMGVYPNFNKFIFQYNVKEGAGSSKAQVLKYVYEKFKEEDIFIYMDTDLKVFGPFEEIESILLHHHLVLTSRQHLLNEPFGLERFLEYRHFGLFNSGFVALKRHPLSEGFIDWWAKRLETLGYFNKEQGIFSDQTWLDFAPVFFNAHALHHSGYNVGPWNFNERYHIRSTGKGDYVVNGFPLRCFHFSLLHSYYLKKAREVPVDRQEMLMTLREQYISELISYKEHGYDDIPWSYDFFQNGSKILKSSRRSYRNNVKFQHEDPFTLTNQFFESRKKKR